MAHRRTGAPYDDFEATAVAFARSRPEVGLEIACEVMLEAAALLDDGLALDGLDPHDSSAIVAALCVDLVADDPGAAVRARAQAVVDAPGDLHDAEGVSAALLISAAVLQL